MKLKDIIETLGLSRRFSNDNEDIEVTNGYAGDLLSDVLANSYAGGLWITLQVHPNTVAIASMKGLAAIVLINSREPEPETIRKAKEENIPILVSTLPAFELIGKLYTLGIRGKGDGPAGV
jgi:hypothetical protein